MTDTSVDSFFHFLSNNAKSSDEEIIGAFLSFKLGRRRARPIAQQLGLPTQAQGENCEEAQSVDRR